jgi:hypothetical protein
LHLPAALASPVPIFNIRRRMCLVDEPISCAMRWNNILPAS